MSVQQSADIPLRKFYWCLVLNLFRINRKGLSMVLSISTPTLHEIQFHCLDLGQAACLL